MSLIFTGRLVRRSPSGHFLMHNVRCSNGMARDHLWIRRKKGRLLRSAPMPSFVYISGNFECYRSGPDGWTIGKIDGFEVIK